MEDQIRQIVGIFIKKEPHAITPDTHLDRKALGSSIALHRMYGRLSEKGILVDNYHTIKTYGDLLARVGAIKESSESRTVSPIPVMESATISNSAMIGIDIEQKASFHQVSDYRSDAFYSMNFTPQEIAYGILQPDPLQTFAGLFAAKEAILKADNGYRAYSFNEIGITHDKDGKPFFYGMDLSISHAGDYAVAVAVSVPQSPGGLANAEAENESVKHRGANNSLAWFAIVISLLSILFTLYKNS